MHHPFLIGAGIVSAAAAAIHTACIVYGARWYRFFGAGERMVRLAEAGRRLPAWITGLLAAVLVLWSLYALVPALAGIALPGARWVLIGIAVACTGRGAWGLILAMCSPGSRGAGFW